MIKAWRMAKKKYQGAVLSGDGAKENPGRWNSFGTPMVYTCNNPSLAVLEVRVNSGPEGEGMQYSLCSIEIPKALIERLDPDTLPPEWNRIPPSPSTQVIGSNWAGSRRSAVLQVPSVIVPDDFNLLINPFHEDFKKLRIIENRDYFFDSRLWGTRK